MVEAGGIIIKKIAYMQRVYYIFKKHIYTWMSTTYEEKKMEKQG